MKRTYFILGCLAAVVVVVIALSFAVRRSVRNFFYPKAPPMPQAVNQSLSAVLAQLEIVLKAKAPNVLAELQPGLTEMEISNFQHQAGIQLPPELKVLYRWRDGSKSKNLNLAGPIPGHRFVPLSEAITQLSTQRNQVASASVVQRVAFGIFAGHRKTWIPLFEDGAGDGYYVDPMRKPYEGAVFFNFAEDTSYIFYPSVGNLT